MSHGKSLINITWSKYRRAQRGSGKSSSDPEGRRGVVLRNELRENVLTMDVRTRHREPLLVHFCMLNIKEREVPAIDKSGSHTGSRFYCKLLAKWLFHRFHLHKSLECRLRRQAILHSHSVRIGMRNLEFAVVDYAALHDWLLPHVVV